MKKRIKVLSGLILVLNLFIAISCSDDDKTTKPLSVATPVFSHKSGVYNTFLQIVIYCPTTESIIRYTTDGSQPTEESQLYYAPIDIKGDTTIKAQAFKQDSSPSDIASAQYDLELPTVATPSFTPEQGTYNFSQEIEISSSTPNVEIYYTLDQSNPTELSEIYNSPIIILDDTIIKAKAFKDNYFASETTSAFYIINFPAPSNPNPMDNATNVSLTPTLSWDLVLKKNIKRSNLTFDVYLGTSSNLTLVSEGQTGLSYIPTELTEGRTYYWKVIVNDVEMEFASPTWLFTTEEAVIEKVADPTFSPDPGVYNEAQFLQLFCETANASIYYSLDGSQPSEESQIYDNPINITTSTTIRAKAFKDNFQPSSIVSATFTIDADATPGFVHVAGGTFNNGTADVTLSSFYIGKYEVTQAEYEAVMGTNPAQDYGVGTDYPVYYVTWFNALQYCNARSINEGLSPCYNESDWSCDFSANGYRLPTEMEWMFAAKGGNEEPSTGYNIYSGTNDESELPDYAWYSANNSPNGNKEIGTKLPNQLELYDMSGNVWEWCWDWLGDYSSESQMNPLGPTSGSRRVLRGGGWNWSATNCRVLKRYSSYPSGSVKDVGFRLVRNNSDSSLGN